MTGALVQLEQERRLPVSVTFSYDTLDADLADRLRARAQTIRSSIRTQTDAMIDIGRDLVEIKDSLDHGAFAGWVELECGIAPRLAQLYMRAADWAKSNAKLISHLQPTSVMKLAAPSTPSTVLTLVAERVDAGEPFSAKTVDTLLRKAREEKQEEVRLAKEAAVPKRTKEARKARQDREARERDEWYRQQQEEKAKTRLESDELADILVTHLSPDVLERVKLLLLNKDVTRQYHCYFAGKPEWRVRLVDVIKALQRQDVAFDEEDAASYYDFPIIRRSSSAENDLVNEGGIMDLWVREAHAFKATSSTTPIVADHDHAPHSLIQKRLDDARNELAIAQRKGDYQSAGELAYGTIPRLEKQLAQITEEHLADNDFTPPAFLTKGALAS